jgi:hypothetical protein
MANLIIPEYPCAQKDLYSILETAWANYKVKLTDFEDHKAMYTASYGVDALVAVASAKAMPDNVARTTIAETMRVELVDLGLICLKNFRKLESYIKTAFPNEDLWEIQFDGAGQNYYAEAANEDWESLQLMLQSGHNYIDLNETLLLGVAPNLNMPATFFASFDAAAAAFNAKYLAFKSAEETSEATAAKVKANNECYSLAIDMMADGQLIFSDNAEAKKLFVFNTLWELINPPVSGVKGTVMAAGTNSPLASAIVKTQKTGEVAVQTLTNADGEYSKQLSIGDYIISVNADGYVSKSINVTMNATGFKTFDFEMVGV